MERKENSRKKEYIIRKEKGSNVVYICPNDVGPSETSVSFYKPTRHSQRPELFNYEINSLHHTYLRTSSLEMRCSYMQYRRRYDSLVPYRL